MELGVNAKFVSGIPRAKKMVFELGWNETRRGRPIDNRHIQTNLILLSSSNIFLKYQFVNSLIPESFLNKLVELLNIQIIILLICNMRSVICFV